MATVDEILATMPDVNVVRSTNEVLVIDANTRQISIPGSELVFGVEADAGSERKYFLCSRYVGNNIDLASCFLRVNYRNANGEIDEYLVDDVTVNGDNVTFSWVVSPKAVSHKGMVAFVVCAIGANLKLAWHTTLASGIVLEGLEPNNSHVEAQTSDVVAQLIAMVEAQTVAVEAEGGKQIKAVQTAAEVAEAASVAEIEAKGVNTRASIPDDYTALSEAVDGLVRSRAGAIVCEAEGSAVVVNDASDNYIHGLRIFGRSTQDGVPSPDAPVEIVSVDKPVVTVCGKNLLPNAATNESYNGITIVVNEDKSITVNGTATGNVFYAPYRFTFKAGQSYVLNGCPKNGSADTYFMYVNNLGGVRDYGNGVVVNLDEDFTSDVGFSIRAGTKINNLTFYPMVKVGTTVDGYEPRKSVQTVELTHTLPGIPVTSGGNYTDSDGQQWICDEVDFERGVYVQRTRERSFVGTETYSDYTSEDAISAAVWHIPNTPFFCTRAKENLGVRWANNKNITFTASYFSVSSVEDFKALLMEWNTEGEPLTIVYALETPTETPLSETEIAAYRALHTNKPNTTVLNDADAHMAVAYAADTKLYIDNKIKEALQ